jgi:hypothetical protein
MATRFFLQNQSAPYTPATIRGAWDATGSAVTKKISTDTQRSSWDTATSVSIAETSADTEYDVLLYRGVSGPLKGGTIGTGTVNVMLPIYESNAAADMHFHLHIYVTQGDSDTVRGTLLSDYREAAGTNEFGTSNSSCGKSLNAAQSLSSVVVSDGDRLVVEIGYAARNSVTTSYSTTLYYGQLLRNVLSAGGAYDSGNGYVEFSEDFSSDPQRVSQVVAEVAQAQSSTVRISQVVTELLLTSVIESRLSQAVVELLLPVVIESRVSQAVVESLNAGTGNLRLSQYVLEVMGKSPHYCGVPSVSPSPLCGKPDVLAWLEWTVPMRES